MKEDHYAPVIDAKSGGTSVNSDGYRIKYLKVNRDSKLCMVNDNTNKPPMIAAIQVQVRLPHGIFPDQFRGTSPFEGDITYQRSD